MVRMFLLTGCLPTAMTLDDIVASSQSVYNLNHVSPMELHDSTRIMRLTSMSSNDAWIRDHSDISVSVITYADKDLKALTLANNPYNMPSNKRFTNTWLLNPGYNDSDLQLSSIQEQRDVKCFFSTRYIPYIAVAVETNNNTGTGCSTAIYVVL